MELISRERLIDEVVKIAKTSESDWRGVKFSAGEIKFIIERQKPIESRPKGKWNHHKTKSNKNWYECDSCGWVHFQKSNYCPNCGADMRGE